MGLFDFFKADKQVEQEQQTQLTMAKFLNDIPIFSQFGKDIYSSDVVQNCIDAVAKEISKVQPKHIRIDADGVRNQPPSSINRLFKNRPNPLMTTKQFLEKCIWLLFLNYNLFIYPMYEIYRSPEGIERKRYTGFYPLQPTQVEFLQDENGGTLWVRLTFSQGEQYTLPYERLIHIRKKFSVNDVMGGGRDGQPDNDPLLKILETNNTVIEGTANAVKSSLGIKGILYMKTMALEDSKEEEIAKFEAQVENGNIGVVPIDAKNEFKEVKIDPKLIDKDTMEFMDQKILRWFGVSASILNGEFTEDEYQAFYEKALEDILIDLSQGFTGNVFSQREIDMGNEITFYQKNLMFLNVKTKLDIIKTAGEQGLLKDDQKLELLGYPPIGGEEGNRRTQSLNFVDVELVNEYQMTKAATPMVQTSTGNGGSNE